MYPLRSRAHPSRSQPGSSLLGDLGRTTTSKISTQDTLAHETTARTSWECCEGQGKLPFASARLPFRILWGSLDTSHLRRCYPCCQRSQSRGHPRAPGLRAWGPGRGQGVPEVSRKGTGSPLWRLHVAKMGISGNTGHGCADWITLWAHTHSAQPGSWHFQGKWIFIA